MKKIVREWLVVHQLQITLFNGFLMLLILLRSAGYFEPFIPISINLIFISALVLSIFLLGINSKGAVAIALIFWMLAGFFRVFLKIDVWAERTALYAFEALVIGVFLLIIETISSKRTR